MQGDRSISEVAAGPTQFTRVPFPTFLSIAFQLLLVLSVYILFNIEIERGFSVIAGLTLAGFLIHSWLPFRVRLPFFVVLTVLAVGILMKGDGIYLLALGLGFLGLCHLPLPWLARLILIVMAACGVAALRLGLYDASWSDAVIPVLAAIFMFRIVIYLYDLKNDYTPATRCQRISYFFMLPNICFPLFPVIDYKTYLRTYYDAPAAEIYQKGVHWMFRGLCHLILYRILYQLLPRAETDLSGIVGVYVFMAMTYALYLRVSGLFHLITGLLALFGFNLPRTNHHYFLASSFTDLWRRINIYWKDFMMNTVFYPCFMSVRNWPMSRRLVFGTAAVFLVTWFLHSYQWFWLEGSFPIAASDIAFWGLLGLALAVNTVWEARFGRRRVSVRVWSLRQAASRTLKTLGVFSTMAVLWSLWSSGSFTEWSYRLLRITESSSTDWMVFSLMLISILLIGIGAQWLGYRGWGLERIESTSSRYASRIIPATAIAIGVVGLPAVYANLGEQLPRFVVAAKSPEPNQIDLERQERSYYEALSRTTEMGNSGGYWESFQFTPGALRTGDLRGITVAPSVEMMFKGGSFHSNSLGMRDREYAVEKPPSTIRIAILGSSHVMGSGVDDRQTFENLLEERLNRRSADGPRYEVLNFAVPGYGLLQATVVAEKVLPRFKPDIVIYFIHPGEGRRAIERIRWALELGGKVGSDYEYVSEIMKRSDARPELPAPEFTHRLLPYRKELIEWTYDRQVHAIRDLGAIPVFVFLPGVGRDFDGNELYDLRRAAERAGAAALSLTDVYQGEDARELRLAEWDDHPNAHAHALIAEELYQELSTQYGDPGTGAESRRPDDSTR